jgi:hypothetical protein
VLLQSAQILDFSQEIQEYKISIRSFYHLPHIFDHVVKYHYQELGKRVLVLGTHDDSYYAVHVRNILREECSFSAPLVELQFAERVELNDFDEVLVCYNKYLVQPLIKSWASKVSLPIVYLDDLIARYHWIFHYAEALSTVYGLRDVVRGLSGQPIEETRALQFDAWRALRRDLIARGKHIRNLFVHGSGCGILPLLLRDCATNVRVYDSNPAYNSSLRVSQHVGKCSIYEESQIGVDLKRVTDEDCVVFCDSFNRCADPADVVTLMASLEDYYVTSFLSCPTKPMQRAMFRAVGDRNVAFGAEDRRDLRCLAFTHRIWLPREGTFEELLGTKTRVVYENNEHFGRNEEYASGYVVLTPLR